MVEIRGLPLPPSENQLYRNVPRIGRVKSQIYRKYEQEFNVWALQNKLLLKASSLFFQEAIPLRIEMKFKFFYNKIYCKDGRIKKMDASNRLKCFLDLLSKSLGFDDSRFFEVSCQKCIAAEEGVDIKITKKEVENLTLKLQTKI